MTNEPTPEIKDLTVFVDTNAFLHLRDLEDLPWRSLFPGVATVRVAIAPIVIDELDRHKEDASNRRRRDRARAALRKIDAASEGGDSGAILRGQSPEVRLVVPEDRAVVWESFPTLKASSADDQLVAFVATAGNGVAALLSVDSGPRIKARRLGLSSPTPPDEWRLPDPIDDPTRELARVSQALERLQAIRPSLTFDIQGLSDEGEFRHTVWIPPELSEKTISLLVAEIGRRFPIQQVKATSNMPFATQGMLSGEISREDAAIYQGDYRAFLAEQAQKMGRLHIQAFRAMMFAPLVFSLRNDSTVTAVGLHVRVFAAGAGRLLSDRHDLIRLGGALGEPRPPKPPTGYAMLPDFGPLVGHGGGDPTIFSERDTDQGHLLECPEFRPNSTSRVTVWWSPEDRPAPTDLRFEVSASNLADPIVRTVRVTFVKGERAWSDPDILDRLPAWMADIICGSE